MQSVRRILYVVGLLTAVQSAFAQLDVPSLVINEIHYDEADKTVAAEFIEVYNPTESAISLEGWEISGGVDFLFPPGTSIESGAYLIIAQDPATIESKFRRGGALGPWSGRLRNSGETVN
ncbi:MAG: lamin tail domain-containing protein, partial [Roseibacillus sp.]|nr:lamin tail domain-containing protein [Roseibacillus sp.]